MLGWGEIELLSSSPPCALSPPGSAGKGTNGTNDKLYLDEWKFSELQCPNSVGLLMQKDTTRTKTVFMHNYTCNLVPEEEGPGTRPLLGAQFVGSCGRIWWEGLECCDMSQSCSGSFGSDWDLDSPRTPLGGGACEGEGELEWWGIE